MMRKLQLRCCYCRCCRLLRSVMMFVIDEIKQAPCSFSVPAFRTCVLTVIKNDRSTSSYVQSFF